jgi:DtxR family Mn-dependent transcriptional regulator
VLEKEDFDDSLSIEIDGEKLSISKKIANNLYLKK